MLFWTRKYQTTYHITYHTPTVYHTLWNGGINNIPQTIIPQHNLTLKKGCSELIYKYLYG